MTQPFYELTILDNAHTFNFESVGLKTIPKKILYQKTNRNPFYNLALIDVLDDGTFDDKIESKNGDMEKIMATVAQTLPLFFE
jgi:hypothetical protein